MKPKSYFNYINFKTNFKVNLLARSSIKQVLQLLNCDY